jgi:3'(2'), 5'-bisphosphate nucleotidase
MYTRLIPPVLALARQASDAILQVYHGADFGVQYKADHSPLTQADLAANAIIVHGLTQLLKGVPVLSEEGAQPDWKERQQWARYWLVDPLDGTKEFIKRNGEFTVNIALIENNRPVLGVVWVPTQAIGYSGALKASAMKYTQGGTQTIHTRRMDTGNSNALPPVIMVSRNNGADAVHDALLQRIKTKIGSIDTHNIGSSLKLCLIAEGVADLYPRLAPTSEWDTAASQAVVEAAGGQVLTANFEPLRYNSKDDILNPFFYAIGDSGFNWQAILT